MPFTEDEVIYELKRHWKITSLTFEAEFHIPKNGDGSFKKIKGGFFNKFTIPGRNNFLWYPRPTEVNGSNGESVSFRYQEKLDLQDCKRYQVTLAPEENSKRIQNSIQLKIKNVEEITPGISFFGQFRRFKDDRFCLSDLMYKDSGTILMNDNGTRALSFISPGQATDLKEYGFYEFRAHLHNLPQKGLHVEIEFDSITACDTNPYEKIIDFCYDRMDNPIANEMLANMMLEVGKGLYSSKQRMIFELLQNADDTPAGGSLVFNIIIIGDYLTIYHNGLPFSADDVKAITSAAQSTKRSDAAKTGYKGIGFKSVFTESDEVLVRSGGFRFVFRRSHQAFLNFENFYFNREKYRKYPGLKDDELLRFNQQRQKYNPRKDVPWQMIPHWEPLIPAIIADDGKKGIHSNVFFGLNFGSTVAAEYLTSINVFAAKPHFMLFLRNVSEFNAGNDLKVKKTGDSQVTITSSSHGEKSSITYIKRRFTGIEISDEAFAEEKISLFKKQEKNGYNISTYYFADAEGKAIESIPPKLAEFDETVLTLAVPVIDGALQAEPDYISGEETSCIYTYLPMNETRIRLPFLVNADFVPSSDREELQGDNAWNVFILAKIAVSHISWLKELAIMASQDIISNKRYLSLVLKDQLTGHFAVTALIEKYNEVYLGGITEAAFILSDENTVIKADETILDPTGISAFDSGKLFYQLTKEYRKLPHPELESHYLSAAYLKIAVLTDKTLLEVFSPPENTATLGNFINNADNDDYKKFLHWLNAFLSRTEMTFSAISLLPLVRNGKQVMTINDALANPLLLIKMRKLEPVEMILSLTGFELTEFFLDDYPSLFADFLNGDHYLAKNERLFERIAQGKNLTLLSPADKNALLNFLSGLTGIGEKKFAGELKMFCSLGNSANGKALNEMIVSDKSSLPSWLKDQVIKPEEQQALDENFQMHLVKTNEVFKKLLKVPAVFANIASGLKPDELDSFYAFLTAAALVAEKADKENFQTFPSLFSGTVWKMPTEVFYSDSLIKLTNGKYGNVQMAATALSGAIFPHSSALSFIKAAGLQCRSELNIGISASLGISVLNDFLAWFEDDTFFATACIKKTDGDYFVSIEENVVQYYNDDTELQKIIAKKAVEKSLLSLPHELYFKGIERLGLLTGISLFEWMIINGFPLPELAIFISKSKNGALTLAYLDAFVKLELDDDSEYGPQTQEHIILDLLINQSGADETFLKCFSEKITINGNDLAGYNVSDRVYFKFKDDNKPFARSFELSLSSILPIYKDSARTVTTVLNNFSDFKGKSLLRDKIFSAEEKPHKSICAEIAKDPKKFLTTWQVFFLLLYQEKNPADDVFGEKDDFAVWFKDKDPLKFEKLCKKLMSIFYEQNYDVFLDKFSFAKALNNNLIIDSEFTTDSEKIPAWLENWLVTEPDQQKKSFLVRAGLQGPAGQVVLLRDAIQHKKILQYEKSLAMLEDAGQMARTLAWLAENQLMVKLPLTEEFLKPLYKKCSLLDVKTDDLLIPVMTSVSGGVYRLVDYELTGDVHLKNSGWEGYEKEIFNYVKSINGEIIDVLMPESYYSSFAQFTESVTEEPHTDRLDRNSFSLPSGFYQEWSEKDSWPVLVYKGNSIPGNAVYCKTVIKGTSYGAVANCGKNYYISSYHDLHELMMLLRSVLPESAMNSLRRFKEEYDERRRREQEEANYTDEELSALNQMFSNKVPGSFFKDLNLASLIKGLFYLKNLGYNISEAEENLPATHQFSNLSPVYPPGTEADPANALTISCRSAKGGLLFLTAKAWKNLASPNKKLYILTGRDYTDSIFCLNRDEILADKDADFQLMRIKSGKKASAIDNVLNGTSDQEDLQLVIRMRKSERYDSVFIEVFKKQKSDSIRGAQTENEDLY